MRRHPSPAKLAPLLFFLLGIGASASASQTVAVMPFRDLSGASGSIGEAIRETVTADLKQLSEVKVIERGSLDKILNEQQLQAQRSDLDLATTARLGKLLGATLIVTGAYQKAQPQIRLTARFVRVETGEIVGTAKVDGRETEFLKLQDRITAELLKSAGLGSHVKHFADRVRPSIKSLRTLELYGDAVVADNDDKRRHYLELALAEDANFSYAVTDLAALEKRLQKYQSVADAAQEQKLIEAKNALAKETDPTKASQLTFTLLNGLLLSHRYRAMARLARAIIAHPPSLPASTQPGMASVEENAAFYLLSADRMLKDEDALLRDGESFMRRYPSSLYFSGAKSMVEAAIEQKRKVEAGKQGAEAELAKLSAREKWDLCRVAQVYGSNHQAVEARRLYRACLDAGKSNLPRRFALQALVLQDLECADWAQARTDMAVLEKEEPDTYRQMKALYDQTPVD